MNRDIVLPKSSLGYNSNNVYPFYPPLMSDGRALVATDQSETILNNDLLKTAGVKTNWDYRKFLTDNSLEIERINRYESFNDVGYYKRFASVPSQTTDSQNDSFQEKRTYGQDPNLQELYMSRQELNSQIFAPTVTDEYLRNLSKY